MSDQSSTEVAIRKEKIERIEAEVKQIQQRKQQLVKQMKAGMKKAQALVEFAEKELKRADQEPSPERRARLIRMNQLRLAAAKNNLESLTLVQSLDPEQNPAPQFVHELEMMGLRGQYLLTEYNYTNFLPIMGHLEDALGIRRTVPDTAEAAPTGTGPLGRPGVPGARPAVPARPGVPMRPPAGGTGPLARPVPPAAGTGPLGAAALSGGPARPPLPPRPVGAPPNAMRAPLRPPTGPLGANEQKPVLDPDLGPQLKAAAEDPATRDKLKDLLIRSRDLETSLAPLRGEQVGELSIAIEDAATMIRQIAGKVYYINRVLSGLGTLGEKMAFQGDGPDPAVEKLLAAVPEDGAAPPAPAGQPQGQAQISSRLRTLFKG